MAMQISKPSNFGVTAVYWRIVAARFDFISSTVQADLAGYVSKDARAAGANPVASMTIDAVPFTGDPRTALYEWLKQQPDWAGEIDA